ncbi:MAG: HPr family phosphocarrier protein [Gammaproteobacteria bacterium]|nr:HPr family phosphocarrier protein [Gammaproteobacteria bacterium]
MLSKTIKLINPLGLHARAASKFVDVTKGFASHVTLTKDDKAVDGKSIMNLLMLGAPVGTELTLTVEGDDEDVAFASINDLVEAGFHELDD